MGDALYFVMDKSQYTGLTKKESKELLTKTTKVCVAGVEQSKSKYHLGNK